MSKIKIHDKDGGGVRVQYERIRSKISVFEPGKGLYFARNLSFEIEFL